MAPIGPHRGGWNCRLKVTVRAKPFLDYLLRRAAQDSYLLITRAYAFISFQQTVLMLVTVCMVKVWKVRMPVYQGFVVVFVQMRFGTVPREIV